MKRPCKLDFSSRTKNYAWYFHINGAFSQEISDFQFVLTGSQKYCNTLIITVSIIWLWIKLEDDDVCLHFDWVLTYEVFFIFGVILSFGVLGATSFLVSRLSLFLGFGGWTKSPSLIFVVIFVFKIVFILGAVFTFEVVFIIELIFIFRSSSFLSCYFVLCCLYFFGCPNFWGRHF